MRLFLQALTIAVIWAGLSGAGLAANKPAGIAAGPELGAREGASLGPVAVYLSVKLPKATFVVASTRQFGADYRRQVEAVAGAKNMEIVLPVVTDLLQEAMTAVRIAANDTRGLSNIARMHGAKIILAGRLVRGADGTWSAAWSASTLAGSRRWKAVGGKFDDAVGDGLDVIAKILAGDLAVMPYPPRRKLPLVSEDIERRMYEGRPSEGRGFQPPEQIDESAVE